MAKLQNPVMLDHHRMRKDWVLVDRAGIAQINEIKYLERLTGTLSLRFSVAGKVPMATLSEPPDKRKAPDLAATGSSAHLNAGANWHGTNTNGLRASQ